MENLGGWQQSCNAISFKNLSRRATITTINKVEARLVLIAIHCSMFRGANEYSDLWYPA